MNSFTKKVLSVAFMFVLIIVAGSFTVFAESDNEVGIHIPDIEIGVCSPIADMIGVDVDAQVLFEFAAQNATQIQVFDNSCAQNGDVFASHQEQIDSIIATVHENGIDNLHELTAFLHTLQCDGCYLLITPHSCVGGCAFIPVWVTIGGVRQPALGCTTCGRIIILT